VAHRCETNHVTCPCRRYMVHRVCLPHAELFAMLLAYGAGAEGVDA
jgi:hypothetical protein